MKGTKMKKSLLFLGIILGIGNILAAAEKNIIEELIFSDPTTYPSHHAKSVTKYKNVKVFSSEGYPMLVIPVQRESDKPVKVLIRAAADPSVKPLAKIGLLVQVYNPKTKKFMQSEMQIRQLTDTFTDYVFRFDPAKLNANKNYRLCIYCFGRKGKPFLEKIQIFTDK